MATASQAYRRAAVALDPTGHIVQCVKLDAGGATARYVKGYQAVSVGGARYEPAAFDVQISFSDEGRQPSATLVFDHAGRALAGWIAAAKAATSTVTIMEGVAGGAVGWSLKFRVRGEISAGLVVRVPLGLVPILGLPSVRLRYDPETAPGLF